MIEGVIACALTMLAGGVWALVFFPRKRIEPERGTCENCEFWGGPHQVRKHKDRNDCTARAPDRRNMDRASDYSFWLKTPNDWSCGEWRARREIDA